jgi:hypothetical protein
VKAIVRAVLLGVFFCGMLSFGTASAASLIATQAPCNPNGRGYCVLFYDTTSIPIVRSFSFSAPSAGTAQVTFNGSLFCVNTNLSTTILIDLDGQIVTTGTAVPDDNGPGGVRYTASVQGASESGSSPFNLSTTRVRQVASQGTQRFYFRLKKNRVDSGAKCFVINAAFSVVFIP